MARISSLCERPRSDRPRRLADWLNPTGEQKVHSLIPSISLPPGNLVKDRMRENSSHVPFERRTEPRALRWAPPPTRHRRSGGIGSTRPRGGKGVPTDRPLVPERSNTPRLDSVSPKLINAQLTPDGIAWCSSSLAPTSTGRSSPRGLVRSTRKDAVADWTPTDRTSMRRIWRPTSSRCRPLQVRARAVRRVHIPDLDGRKTRPPRSTDVSQSSVQEATLWRWTAGLSTSRTRDCSFGFALKAIGLTQATSHNRSTSGEQTTADGRDPGLLDLDDPLAFSCPGPRTSSAVVDQRGNDGVLGRAIDKWLKAGVCEHRPGDRSVLGTPKVGSVAAVGRISTSTMSGEYDIATEVQPRLRGRSVLVTDCGRWSSGRAGSRRGHGC